MLALSLCATSAWAKRGVVFVHGTSNHEKTVTGNGSGGNSGATCFNSYSFGVISGNTYTISTCDSFSGDPYLKLTGVYAGSNDDSCGLGSKITFTAAATGTETVCASGYGSGSVTSTYKITGNITGSGTAINDYWTQSSINSMTAGDPYLVVGYQGCSSKAFEIGAWGAVADQIGTWADANAVTSVVVITHSNGINPVRYLLAHAAAVTPGGRSVSSVTNKFKRIVNIAGSAKGTPLAGGGFTGWVVAGFFCGSFTASATLQQRTADMATYNSNGTFANGTAPGGVTTTALRGTTVYVNWFSSQSNCGGWTQTQGLALTSTFGFGGGCNDGFIGCDSSQYVGVVRDSSYTASRANHNQSRRSCNGINNAITSEVTSTTTLTATPEDYNVSPAAQACNATTQQWSGSFFFYGCPDAWRTDGITDFDCQLAYGNDNGAVLPTDYATSAFANGANYPNLGGACSDTWMGDGTCDLCLIAKYGYDAANGVEDDCTNDGAGTSDTCYDLAWNDAAGHQRIEYVGYTAVH